MIGEQNQALDYDSGRRPGIYISPITLMEPTTSLLLNGLPLQQ
jgi:hypothetical protein